MLSYVIKYYMHTALQFLAMSMKRWRAFVVPRQISSDVGGRKPDGNQISLLSVCEVGADCNRSEPVAQWRAHRSSASALASRAQDCSSPVNATYEIIHCTFIMHGHIAKKKKIQLEEEKERKKKTGNGTVCVLPCTHCWIPNVTVKTSAGFTARSNFRVWNGKTDSPSRGPSRNYMWRRNPHIPTLNLHHHKCSAGISRGEALTFRKLRRGLMNWNVVKHISNPEKPTSFFEPLVFLVAKVGLKFKMWATVLSGRRMTTYQSQTDSPRKINTREMLNTAVFAFCRETN